MMKGKKSDRIFIADFIQESVQIGASTTDEIVNRAKKKIEIIDKEIIAIEEKKITRSKLLDVIANFEKKVIKNANDIKILSFYSLQYPDRCKEICIMLNKGLEINNLPDISITNFCNKQLIDNKILKKENGKLTCGEKFNEYIMFLGEI